MTQNQTGSNVLGNLLQGTFGNRNLSVRQANKLVATINCQLSPMQQKEVKGYFVFGESPSLSTRSAFETAAQTIIQNKLVLNALVA